jgi:hypothetical protein
VNSNELIQVNPIAVEKSARSDQLRCITSGQPGKIIPLCFVPLLREDAVSRGDIRVSFDMSETLYPLLNAVNVKVMAHFISNLALDRFAGGIESLNRSYQGIPEPVNSTVIPWAMTLPFTKNAPIWKSLGVQWKETDPINRMPVEAYNLLVNWRRRARTDKLPQRLMTDVTLAEAFWKNTQHNSIVPDWDQAAMEGEVELTFPDRRLPIQGIGRLKTPFTGATVVNPVVLEGRETGAAQEKTYPWGYDMSTQAGLTVRSSAAANGAPLVFAEMSASNVTLSLANIELAKQTAAFAKLREKFDGLDDDHIIDLLMEGIRVPDEALKQPILLDSKSTIFGMSERKAMDGDNLDKSLTSGRTEVALRFRTPPMNTGGIVLVTCEIVPEQLYERTQDAYLAITDPAKYPNFMRDYLDPEKVQVVQNNYVDVHHTTPTAVFGYQPLNDHWKRQLTKSGGKFYRPNPDVFVEDRMRFWSADQVNPTLVDDFYMVSDLPNSVFADTLADPFEILTLGNVNIIGNTVFGDRLEEDTGSYDEIASQVDNTRITQVAVPGATALIEGEAK